MISNNDLEAFEYYDMFPETLDKKRQTMLDMVKEFQKLSGQIPTAHLYANLIDEEHGEWRQEYLKGTAASELKELTDLLYVIMGYAVSRNWDVLEAFRRVHENNVGRMFQPDGSIKRRADGKIEKNKDYPKVNLEDLA